MTYRYPDAILAVFCKAPIVGDVKTRLMPELSAQQAADVHVLLTRRLLAWLDQAQICPITLWCSPDCSHPFFQACTAEYGVSLKQQKGSDLGARMQDAITSHLTESNPVLLIGCDSPSVTASDVSEMIEKLMSGDDVVVAPAEDGGYVMIGCSGDYPLLFSAMTWSTVTVFDNTCQRANYAGIQLSTIKMQWDVDNFNDWQRFCALE
jgi:rSAM/selenodomain-associated transferase 1